MENQDVTSSRRAPLIDTDVHNGIKNPRDLLPYLDKPWHQQWIGGGTGVGQPFFTPVGVLRKDAVPDQGGISGSDPAFMVKDHIERYGFDYIILTGQNVLEMSLNPDIDYGNAVISAYNDYLIDHWLSADPRFKGAMVISHADPQYAAKEIARVGGHPDIVEVVMCSGATRLYGHRSYHPIYEAAEKAGLPVAIHPGTEGRGLAGPPTPSGYPSRYMEWHNILPTNYMAHVNSLVCEGVFEKYPGLKVVAIEGGIAWLPHLMWRMDKNYKALRDTTPWLKKLPSEYIREHIYLTTQPIEEPSVPEHLVQLIQMCGAEDRIMYSSDYPHWDFDHPKLALTGFPKDIRVKVQGGNAAALYGLLPKPDTR
ncbi:amidohydrolase family protein [Paenibacillus thalictri]|uniref:Amidohydrolase n=1 Tax=Paenibacillus thalictri TaxID=2527873 RepID=A0A4Q9DLI8_9BACL|nr:amidohydrolase family protein [Paenibacillus thalictri]TBL76055.1 amidohydrolase [Paenibacillus thalictri]